MRQNVAKPNVVATGGKENELKLWDLEQLGDSTFQAKNVSDMLTKVIGRIDIIMLYYVRLVLNELVQMQDLTLFLRD
jgi:hypothetical protein